MNKAKPSLWLLVLAIGGLIWLFTPFLPALFLALLITITTFNKYTKLKKIFSATNAALIITSAITIIFILPLSYILIISGFEMTILIKNINNNFEVQQINEIFKQIITKLPLAESIKINTMSALNDNLMGLIVTVKDFSVAILKSIISLSSNFLLFLLITIFSMYYFYIDGELLVKYIKNISPLKADINNILLKQFANLTIVLVGSVFIIALLQGLTFSIAATIVGVPAIYFGISIALASFIPIIGGMLIWLPLSLYLYIQGETINALIIVFFGAIIISFIIDNIIRPLVIKKLSQKSANALHHTLITVLSTLAGIIKFGVLGLFIGPIIAAMAISVFNIYIITKNDIS